MTQLEEGMMLLVAHNNDVTGQEFLDAAAKIAHAYYEETDFDTAAKFGELLRAELEGVIYK